MLQHVSANKLAACSRTRKHILVGLLVVEVEEVEDAQSHSKLQSLCGQSYLNGNHDIWGKLIHTSSDVLHVKLIWKALNQVIKHLYNIEFWLLTAQRLLSGEQTEQICGQHIA